LIDNRPDRWQCLNIHIPGPKSIVVKSDGRVPQLMSDLKPIGSTVNNMTSSPRCF
jgi:hypothetical protein